MYIYFITMFFSLLFSYISCYKIKNIATYKFSKRIIWIVLSFLPPFLISALRYGIGIDYFYAYVPIFYSALRGFNSHNTEIAYWILNRCIAFFTEEYQWVFVVTSFIILILHYKAIYQQSVLPYLSLALFFFSNVYLLSFNITRQSIAIAIFVYSVKYIHQRKIVKYYFCSIMSLLFHTTGFMYLPLYFLPNLKISLKKQIVILIGILVCSKYIRILVFAVIEKTKYFMYIDKFDAYTDGVGFGFLGINLVVYLFALLFYKKRYMDSKYMFFLNLQFMSILFALCSSFLPLVSRMVLGLSIYKYIYIPSLLENISNKQLYKFVKNVILILFFLYMYITVSIQGQFAVLPYKTIFQR